MMRPVRQCEQNAKSKPCKKVPAGDGIRNSGYPDGFRELPRYMDLPDECCSYQRVASFLVTLSGRKVPIKSRVRNRYGLGNAMNKSAAYSLGRSALYAKRAARAAGVAYTGLVLVKVVHYAPAGTRTYWYTLDLAQRSHSTSDMLHWRSERTALEHLERTAVEHLGEHLVELFVEHFVPRKPLN